MTDPSAGNRETALDLAEPWQDGMMPLPRLKGSLLGRPPHPTREHIVQQVQKEVNDLALCAGAFGLLREEHLISSGHAALVHAWGALQRRRHSLQASLARQKRLLPHGHPRREALEQELAQLDEECEVHYAKLQLHLRAQEEAADANQELLRRVLWMGSRLSSLGITLDPPPQALPVPGLHAPLPPGLLRTAISCPWPSSTVSTVPQAPDKPPVPAPSSAAPTFTLSPLPAAMASWASTPAASTSAQPHTVITILPPSAISAGGDGSSLVSGGLSSGGVTGSLEPPAPPRLRLDSTQRDSEAQHDLLQDAWWQGSATDEVANPLAPPPVPLVPLDAIAATVSAALPRPNVKPEVVLAAAAFLRTKGELSPHWLSPAWCWAVICWPWAPNARLHVARPQAHVWLLRGLLPLASLVLVGVIWTTHVLTKRAC